MRQIFLSIGACAILELLQVSTFHESVELLAAPGEYAMSHETLQLVDVIFTKALQIVVTILAIYKLYVETNKKTTRKK